jgi:hypothetical protein
LAPGTGAARRECWKHIAWLNQSLPKIITRINYKLLIIMQII